MNNPFIEILIILLLLIINGFFAMSEIAIVTARKVRLLQKAEGGDTKARIALELANNPNQFLSTVQIGITLVGILAGAFGGATIAQELEGFLIKIPFMAPYSGAISVGLVVLCITYFSLTIGELTPKRVALNHAERIATLIAAPMRRLSILVSPFVRLLSVSTDFIVRLLGIKTSDVPLVTEEEIKIMIEQGTQVGVFKESEQNMIEGVLRLGERRVGELITPRTKVVWIDQNDSPEEIKEKVVTSHHSRFPLVKDNLDNVLGIVNSKDILAQIMCDRPLDLKILLREPLFVPEKMHALQVLEIFKKDKRDFALVVDEYGGLQGIVTHEDILEEIVGFIPFISAAMKPTVIQREDGSWLVDGLLDIDSFKELLKLKVLPDEEADLFQTVGGFVMTQMGKIPAGGEWFDFGNYRIEVVDMDGNRIDKVLLKIIPENG